MIVITAPTGLIGHQVLDKVLDGDEPVRVIARDPSPLSPKGNAGAAPKHEASNYCCC